ncbi:MAG TPA: peptidoglycan bridge formation glycyltransferase FemA/FemB family protein, partial [Candidatus Saccharimonadales bacterium]|nr:peptidoglycan bridge formation glycyltransferase FemA/FemB family protein [Candidatus Saccharimonadales bacterium]
AGVSQSTRSYIRKNQREQLLEFKSSKNPKDMPILTDMLRTVAGRNRVNFYHDEYYHKQAEILMPAGMMRLELALDGQKPIASAVIHSYGSSSSYTYAASLPEARSKGASDLLLWHCILESKDRGAKSLDLFGIAPEDAGPRHPWAGISAFKKKFGGQVIERTGTWELPLSGKYRLYRTAGRIRRLVR